MYCYCNVCSSITVGGDWDDDDTSTTYDKVDNKDDDDNAYYATITTFAGPLDFDCNNGSCNIVNSDNNDDCKISAGGTNFTAQLSFFRGLKGNYNTTNANCNTSCRGCSAIPSTEFMILVVKDAKNVVIHTMGTSSIVPNLDNVSARTRNLVQYLLLLPTPVLLNLHAKMVDATILPLLVLDVV